MKQWKNITKKEKLYSRFSSDFKKAILYIYLGKYQKLNKMDRKIKIPNKNYNLHNRSNVYSRVKE